MDSYEEYFNNEFTESSSSSEENEYEDETTTTMMMMMMEALADAVLVEGNVLKLQGFNKVTSIV